LRMEMALDAKGAFVRADAVRLRQVLWNLIRNAVKFTPDGGCITLRTRNEPALRGAGSSTGGEDRQRLVVEVTDSGIGVEPDLLPRLFNAFEQGGSRVTQKYGGLGLGLAISKAIIEMHGGVISAASMGRGAGATFSIALPTAAQPAPAAPAASSFDPAVAMPLSILLVEDHVDTEKVLTRLLRTLGHRVRTAGTVATALSEAEARIAGGERFDLVISDLGLPDGSGLDLMPQLKGRFGLRGVALSGFGMEEDLHKSRAAGFEHHLVKPVKFEKLQEVIQELAIRVRSEPPASIAQPLSSSTGLLDAVANNVDAGA